MDEILMQLGQIGRLKTIEESIEDKEKIKNTDAKKAAAAYNAMKKVYSEYKSRKKHLEFLKRLEADPKPNVKPLGQSQNRQRTRS